MATIMASGRVYVAQALAESLLSGMADRWSHTAAVARRAAELAATVDAADRDVLLVAAWLHDIGYGPVARATGFHPLDGAAYLCRHGWPLRVAALVAHHSAARPVAAALGLGDVLDTYPDEGSAVTDALTYADQTTGPTGQRMTIRTRMAEMLTRHGVGSAQARVHAVRAPLLLAGAARVERRLLAAREVAPGEM
jgi:putative nucleotidyltransferase with HDIG domain